MGSNLELFLGSNCCGSIATKIMLWISGIITNCITGGSRVGHCSSETSMQYVSYVW